jgi:hypothetical protein
MGILAWILGIIGAVCALAGITVAMELTEIAIVPKSFTPILWISFSATFMLMTIACLLAKRQGGE